MKMAMCTMENGKMTSSMEMERIPLQVVIVMKVSTFMERSTDMECIRGPGPPFVYSTMETGKKIGITVMVLWNMSTVANMTDNGRTAKKMAKEFTLGLTEENMKGSTLIVIKRDMECLLRRMVLSMMETGKMIESTVLESNVQMMERLKRVNGMMAIMFDGLKSRHLNEWLS